MPKKLHKTARPIIQKMPRGLRGPLSRLAGKLSKPEAEVVRFSIPGGMEMEADLSEHLAFQLYLRGEFQPVVMDAIVNSIQPGDTVLDIGAHFGYVSLRMAQRAASVHSFEPGKRQFGVLSRNIELNRLEDKVSINFVALLDRIGQVGLVSDDPGNLGHSYVSLGEGDVPATTLDHYTESKGIEKADVVKIDVEGAELMVLQGGASFFEKHPPRAFIYECNPKHCTAFGTTEEEVHAWFTRRGYHVRKLHKHDFIATR
ncbi:MAG: FkbM family methyltransferase [Armatimonadetes bacterium]|nr:FkbM family methyltransferase [Armatimonadota bacterium]